MPNVPFPLETNKKSSRGLLWYIGPFLHTLVFGVCLKVFKGTVMAEFDYV